VGNFARWIVFFSLISGFSSPLHAEQAPGQCVPKLDYANFTIGVEVIGSGYSMIRLGEFSLVQNESASLSGILPEFENISAVFDTIGVNLTCGIPDQDRLCSPMNSSELRPHLIIREARKDRIEYNSFDFNMSDDAYNEWIFGGRNYLFYLKGLDILGNCDYLEGYFCSDSTERNHCMVEKPKVCFVQVSPYYPGGYVATSDDRINLCGCPQFHINAGGKCILPECIEGLARNERCLSAGESIGSRIVNTRCIDGKWRPDLLVSDCSAKNFTCVYAVNGTGPVCTNFTCVDGTTFGSCSEDKPEYCSARGRLAEDIAKCGCPEGFYPDLATLRCIPKACEDGTPVGNCSKTAPFMCIEGELVEMPDLCLNVTGLGNETLQEGENQNATTRPGENWGAGGNASAGKIAPNESAKQAAESAPVDNGLSFVQIAVAALAVVIAIAIYFTLKGGKKEPGAQMQAYEKSDL